ncbi:MAG: hypothetical protein ACREQJ_03485 [Candidatus Binatia bacterium]
MQTSLYIMKTPSCLRPVAVALLTLTTLACSAVRPAHVERPVADVARAPRTAEGSACGIDLLNIVPIGITHRAERARRNAIESSGAKTILTQSITDTSVDLMVATIQCSSVGGYAAF